MTVADAEKACSEAVRWLGLSQRIHASRASPTSSGPTSRAVETFRHAPGGLEPPTHGLGSRSSSGWALGLLGCAPPVAPPRFGSSGLGTVSRPLVVSADSAVRELAPSVLARPGHASPGRVSAGARPARAVQRIVGSEAAWQERVLPARPTLLRAGFGRACALPSAKRGEMQEDNGCFRHGPRSVVSVPRWPGVGNGFVAGTGGTCLGCARAS
jgi:hypothetical protein